MRKRILIVFIVSTSALQAGENHSLCTSSEQIVFGCTLGKKLVSVCASTPFTATTGYVQYRFGTSENLELSFPRERRPPGDTFRLSTAIYSGGGAAAIRFTNGQYEYVLFDRTIRTGFGADQPNDPAFSAGVVTLRNGKRTSLRFCDDRDASIRSAAYEVFPREEFNLDVDP